MSRKNKGQQFPLAEPQDVRYVHPKLLTRFEEITIAVYAHLVGKGTLEQAATAAIEAAKVLEAKLNAEV